MFPSVFFVIIVLYSIYQLTQITEKLIVYPIKHKALTTLDSCILFFLRLSREKERDRQSYLSVPIEVYYATTECFFLCLFSGKISSAGGNGAFPVPPHFGKRFIMQSPETTFCPRVHHPMVCLLLHEAYHLCS